MKKSQRFLSDRHARLALDSLSKAALADLVVDLLRRNAGDETLDGAAFIEVLEEAAAPVLGFRGDPPIKIS